MPLNPKQQRFVLEYLKDSNATQAAIRAGYSPATAYSQGQRLLKHPQVSTELGPKLQKLAKKHDITVERVLKEYGRIAFLNPQDFYDATGRLLPIKEMPEDAARVIAGLEEEDIFERNADGDRQHIGRLKKIRLTAKVPALEGLARHLGMFPSPIANIGVNTGIAIHIHLEGDKDNG